MSQVPWSAAVPEKIVKVASVAPAGDKTVLSILVTSGGAIHGSGIYSE